MLKYWSEDGTSLKAAKRLETTPGSILDFEAVISTSTRDRDGDTLLASGAEIDPAASLLWMHKPESPIGKLIRVTEQNAKRVCGHFAIADTALGRDAKTLIEFGALRISHGFKPLKAEPQKDGLGHVISAWKCLEISVVSVPANEGATVLQHTGGAGLKFYSPEARQLASTLDPEYQRLWQASLGRGKSKYDLDAEDFRRRVLAPRTAAPAIDQQAAQAMVKRLRDIADDMRRAKADYDTEMACREFLGLFPYGWKK